MQLCVSPSASCGYFCVSEYGFYFSGYTIYCYCLCIRILFGEGVQGYIWSFLSGDRGSRVSSSVCMCVRALAGWHSIRLDI